MIHELWECLKFSKSVFGTFNLLFTLVFFLIYFWFLSNYRKIRNNHKDGKIGFIIKYLNTKKAFIIVWVIFIFINFIPVLCYVKHKINNLSNKKTELERKYRDFQSLIIEASEIIKMSQDYYEKIRQQLILYPQIKLSVQTYNKKKKQLISQFIQKDLRDNPECLAFIKKVKRERNYLSPIFIIEKLDKLSTGVCKNSYYTSYLAGLSAIKTDNLSRAAEYLNKSIKIAENKGIYDCTLYHTYAQTLLMLEKYPEAEEFLKKALAFCPYHPYADAHLRILPTLKKISSYKKKVQDFRKKINSLKGFTKNRIIEHS